MTVANFSTWIAGLEIAGKRAWWWWGGGIAGDGRVSPSRNMQMINCGAGGPGHYKDFMYFRAVEHAGLNTIRCDEWVELG